MDRAGRNKTVWVDVEVALAGRTVRVTVDVPAVAYVWVGSYSVDSAPSPKVQVTCFGSPVDVLLKATGRPAMNVVPVALNTAASSGRGWVTVMRSARVRLA